jgi:hypothetical protein
LTHFTIPGIYTILKNMAYDAVFKKRVREYKNAEHTFGEVYEVF